MTWIDLLLDYFADLREPAPGLEEAVSIRSELNSVLRHPDLEPRQKLTQLDSIASSKPEAEQMHSAARFLAAGRPPEAESDLRALVDQWSGPVAEHVAETLGAGRSWQRGGVLAAARAHTLAKHLARLPQDAGRGIVLFPREDLERYDLLSADLSARPSGGSPEKLIWKQTVRIHQALSEVVPVVAELDRRPARFMRRWWFTVLELTHAVERNGFDVWSMPLGPTWAGSAQIAFQTLFGRTTFRG